MAITKTLSLLSIFIPLLLCFISSTTATYIQGQHGLHTVRILPATSCVGYPCRRPLPIWGIPPYHAVHPYYTPRLVGPYYNQLQSNQLLGQLQSNQLFNQHEANQLFRQSQSNQAFNQHELNQLFGQLQNNQALNQHEVNQLMLNAQMAGYLRYPIAGVPYAQYPAIRTTVAV